jgi:hypothetical protein
LKNPDEPSHPRGPDEPLGQGEEWTRRDLNPSNREGTALRTRHDLTVMENSLEKGMDSTGFEPVAFTLQT